MANEQDNIEARLDRHEAECKKRNKKIKKRFNGINARFDKLEKRIDKRSMRNLIVTIAVIGAAVAFLSWLDSRGDTQQQPIIVNIPSMQQPVGSNPITPESTR